MKKNKLNEKANIGIVKTQYFTIDEPSQEFPLESGKKLKAIKVAYETYGNLNKKKSNAILICHSLSGNAHAAGFHTGDKKPGWWNEMIGPGKAFDTNEYFVICSNVIGGCNGTTGPSSINPDSTQPYGLSFPIITIKDMVEVQKRLIDHLEIEKLLCIAGGSMGGMQVLQWLLSYPNIVISAIPIATTITHSPQQIAFNEVGRQAIMADPNWNNGDYYKGAPPIKGLSVARMIGHITYMSEKSMMDKFGRKNKVADSIDIFSNEFEVGGYLKYKGDSFVKRFDANTYLYLTKAIDNFELGSGKLSHEAFKNITSELLIVAFTSDWLYPIHQSREITKACKLNKISVTYCEINSNYGHDAFLLEFVEETHLIKHFLKKVYKN